MKYTFLLLTLIFSTVFANTPVKESDPWKDLDQETSKILDLIANDKLSDALVATKVFEKKNTEIPFHDCLRAAIFYKISEEYRSREFETEFDEAIKSAIGSLDSEAKDKEKGDKYKAKRLQLLGSAYGYRGMARTLSGLWASAFFDGKRAVDVLETSLALDPTLVDNKAGIGTYLYWRSAKAGLVKYLLLWGDKRKEGIDDLKVAVSDGKIVKQWALGGLLRLYIEEKEWQTSLDYANQILKTFPDDVGTLRRKAMVLYMMGKKEDSVSLLKDQLLPVFKSKDNTVLYEKKTLNTANAQIETIYRILKINDELKNKVINNDEKAKYQADIETLKKRMTPSFAEIESYAKKAKEF